MNIYKYYSTAIFSLWHFTESSLCCQQLLAPSFYITIALNFWWSDKNTVNFKIRPNIRADSNLEKLHVSHSTNILLLHPHWFSPQYSPARHFLISFMNFCAVYLQRKVMVKYNIVHFHHVKKSSQVDGHLHDILEHTQEKNHLNVIFVVKNSYKNAH